MSVRFNLTGNLDVLKIFFTAWTVVEIFLLLHAQTRNSKFVLSQCGDADKGTSPSKVKLPRVNCKAYPTLAFRRHSKLPESISRFTDLLRSTKTCHISC